MINMFLAHTTQYKFSFEIRAHFLGSKHKESDHVRPTHLTQHEACKALISEDPPHPYVPFSGRGVGINCTLYYSVLVSPLKCSNRVGECNSLRLITYVPTNFKEGEGCVLWLHLYIYTIPKKAHRFISPFFRGAFDTNKNLFGIPSQSNLGPSLGIPISSQWLF